MNERRNFYRILQTQPDAPMATIRAHYRALMQKMKLHPDLGGEHVAASAINTAYATLRDPLKRAAYDRELLRRYSIASVGSGGREERTCAQGRDSERADAETRNYYRRLEVQPDAPVAIIEINYRRLRDQTGVDDLGDAHAVLTNAKLRSRYDKLLGRYGHTEAVARLHAGNMDLPVAPHEPRRAVEPVASGFAPVHGADVEYEPLIADYCLFCKTPYVNASNPYASGSCADCGSPLSRLRDEPDESTRRVLARSGRKAALRIHLVWPGKAQAAQLDDLTATGLGFSATVPLDSGAVIRVEADEFRAVVEVLRVKRTAAGIAAGARFLAVEFFLASGSFVSESV